jgi:signal transduction histidine kinase
VSYLKLSYLCYYLVVDNRDIEPGFLPVFRLFMAVQIGLILVLVLTLGAHGESAPHAAEALLSMLIPSVIMLGYLSWPNLFRKLGALYFPLGLLATSILPIAGQFLAYRGQSGFASIRSMDLAFQQMLLIFPLLLISWQYGFGWSVLFSVGTGLADFTLALFNFSLGGLEISQYSGALFVRTLTFIAVGYIIARLMNAQREQRGALREANLKLMKYTATLEQLTISQERNRLARELHDTLAHTLSGIAVELEAANTIADTRPKQAKDLYEHSLTITRDGLSETRRALKELRSNPLEDLGLSLALRNMAETLAERSGLKLDLDIPENCIGIPSHVEQGIYRVAQEALENIARHGQAGCMKVELTRSDIYITLIIADDGQGFDVKAVDSESHFGLRGMRERAEMLGGSLIVDSLPGKGTTVRLQVRI